MHKDHNITQATQPLHQAPTHTPCNPLRRQLGTPAYDQYTCASTASHAALSCTVAAALMSQAQPHTPQPPCVATLACWINTPVPAQRRMLP
jgi:hypothetical protein